MKNHVIHARVDQNTFGEIQSLKEALGLTKTTEVISFALHKLFAEQKKVHAQKSPFELMEQAGLIGCIDDNSLSSSRDFIKKTMAESIENKLSNRGRNGF
ncbi:MAG: hypothetical protein WCK49_01610 [Myxococcaceae bacterium]